MFDVLADLNRKFDANRGIDVLIGALPASAHFQRDKGQLLRVTIVYPAPCLGIDGDSVRRVGQLRGSATQRVSPPWARTI